MDAHELIELHGDLVFNLSLRLTRDREEAADLTQDVFVRLLKSAGTFRGEASPRTWICRIVINCHRNRLRWWRRLKRGKALSLEEPGPGQSSDRSAPLGETLADPAAGPERLALSAEVRARIERELAGLPEEQRIALLLRETESMSYAEIASIAGVAEGTVKSRIARAREALRERLGDIASVQRTAR